MRKKIIYITDEQSSTVGLTQSNFVWDAPAPRGCARSPAWHRTARAPGRAAGRRCPGPAWCWSASRPALPTGSRCSARSAAAAFLGAKVIKPCLQRPQNAFQSQHYLSFLLFSFSLEGSIKSLQILSLPCTVILLPTIISIKKEMTISYAFNLQKGVKEKRKASKPLRQQKSCHKTLCHTFLQCRIIGKHSASALVQKQ